MYSVWTKHLSDPADKQRFENKLQGSKVVLKRILELVGENENTLDVMELKESDFDQPNWAEKQAFRNGQRSVLRSMKKLLNLDQQKEVSNG